MNDLGFRTLADSLEEEKKSREEVAGRLIPFGVTFLDATLGGILPNDLILLGARTGAGKTSFAIDIALNASLEDKKVFFFALEAHKNEITQRLKYRLLTVCLKADGVIAPHINYQDYYLGRLDDLFAKYEDIVNEQIAKFTNLNVYYRTTSFGIKEFARVMSAIKDQADLIIIDHIHYFDTQTSDQIKEVGDIMKGIRDIGLLYGVPIFLLAHLRKLDRADNVLVPTLEDFHGTSDLTKIVTKGVILAPGRSKFTRASETATYFRLVKNRVFGAVLDYIGVGYFDHTTNSYSDEFDVGRLEDGDKRFVALTRDEFPPWLSLKGIKGRK